MTQDTPAALNPEHFLPLGAIVNGTTCIERLERDYAFQCEAGPLVNCADWDMLKRCFFHLAEHAQEIAQRAPDEATGWKGAQAATSAAGGATGEWAPDWEHASNEWADMASNGLQWLRNVRDGISTVEDALANMESNLQHCYDTCAKVRAALAAQSPAVPSTLDADLARFGASVDDGSLFNNVPAEMRTLLDRVVAAQSPDSGAGPEKARLLAERVLALNVVTEPGLRAKEAARAVLDDTVESPAELALRSLACWLGVGGYNSLTIDAKVMERRIRDGVEAHRAALAQQGAQNG